MLLTWLFVDNQFLFSPCSNKVNGANEIALEAGIVKHIQSTGCGVVKEEGEVEVETLDILSVPGQVLVIGLLQYVIEGRGLYIKEMQDLYPYCQKHGLKRQDLLEIECFCLSVFGKEVLPKMAVK